MTNSKRTVLNRSIASLALLLAGVVIFVVVVVMFSTAYGLLLTSDNEVALLFLAAVLVAASAIVAFRAVAAGTRSSNKSKRAVRARSIDSLICLLSVFFILVPPLNTFGPPGLCEGIMKRA